ncbi:MAG: helix-turn-helix transcriptional regulator [Prevotella sp.]|nr:helix-turn-helix transcriptional regulator [Prevotella sp.]
MSVGNNIKIIRKALKMNQDEFGDVAGVKRVAVSAWETDASLPRTGALRRITSYTGIMADEIMHGDLSDVDVAAIIEKHRTVTAEEIVDDMDDSHLKPPTQGNELMQAMMADVCSRLEPSDLQMLLMLATRLANKGE